ncbi:putative acyl-coenzyme A synthetase [Metarhizium anisopliae]|nr:putative acyl-coenzyme A synthetase [Metarhizium anisopliae]
MTKSAARDLIKALAHFLWHSYGVRNSGPGHDIMLLFPCLLARELLLCMSYGVIGTEGIYTAASPPRTLADLARQKNRMACARFWFKAGSILGVGSGDSEATDVTRKWANVTRLHKGYGHGIRAEGPHRLLI